MFYQKKYTVLFAIKIKVGIFVSTNKNNKDHDKAIQHSKLSLRK